MQLSAIFLFITKTKRQRLVKQVPVEEVTDNNA